MSAHNPHDVFFKEVFSVKEHAIDFVRGVFPEDLKAKIDFESFLLDTTSYTDDKLKKHFSDLVYTCRFGEAHSLKVALLFEHKSYPVRYPHLQLLRYMLGIWQQQLKQKEPLTPVIPVIVYHGKESWRYRNLESYFQNLDPSLKRFLPGFDYLLNDLSNLEDERIRVLFQNAFLRAAVLLMKKIFDEKRIQTEFFDIIRIDRACFEGEDGARFIGRLIIRYLVESTDITVQDAINKIQEITPKGGEIAMTTADRLREEGKKQGLQQGVQQGLQQGLQQGVQQGRVQAMREVAKTMLARGEDVIKIAEITGLTSKEIRDLTQEGVQ